MNLTPYNWMGGSLSHDKCSQELKKNWMSRTHKNIVEKCPKKKHQQNVLDPHKTKKKKICIKQAINCSCVAVTKKWSVHVLPQMSRIALIRSRWPQETQDTQACPLCHWWRCQRWSCSQSRPALPPPPPSLKLSFPQPWQPLLGPRWSRNWVVMHIALLVLWEGGNK